jgi:hypothetical protein
MIVKARDLLVPMLLAALAVQTGAAWAQSAFPPVSSQSQASSGSPFPPVKGSSPSSPQGGGSQPSAFPPVSSSSASPFPSVSGTKASLPSGSLPPQADPAPAAPAFGGAGPPAGGGAVPEDCMHQADPLREEAQKRAQMVQQASKRHAPAQEACKLIGNFSEAELRFLNFVTTKQTACHIPPDIPKQMKVAHSRTEQMLKTVCAAANAPQQSAGPSLSDVVGSPSIVDDAPVKRKGGSTFDTLNGNVLAR